MKTHILNSASAAALTGLISRPGLPTLASGPTVCFEAPNDGGAAAPADDAPPADPPPSDAAAGDPTTDAPAAEAKPDDDAPTGDEGDDLLTGGELETPEEADKLNGEAVELSLEGLKPPEGFEVLDEEALKAAAPVLAELGVDVKDPAKMQAVIDAYGKAGARLVEHAFQGAIDAHNEKVSGWKEAVRTDKDFAPNERVFKANMAAAERGLAKFFDKSLVADLRESGLANHPAMVKGLAAIGKALAEDATPPPNNHTDKIEPAHQMYPAFAPGAVGP